MRHQTKGLLNIFMSEQGQTYQPNNSVYQNTCVAWASSTQGGKAPPLSVKLLIASLPSTRKHAYLPTPAWQLSQPANPLFQKHLINVQIRTYTHSRVRVPQTRAPCCPELSRSSLGQLCSVFHAGCWQVRAQRRAGWKKPRGDAAPASSKPLTFHGPPR